MVKKKKFVDKNSSSAVTLVLVPTAQTNDAADTDSHQQNSILKRVIPSNALRKGKTGELSNTLKKELDPELFGINENLSTDELSTIYKDVYGSNIPNEIKKYLRSSANNKEAEHCVELNDDVLEKNDCYFPLDGYDYNQHLVALSSSKNTHCCSPKQAPTLPIKDSDENEAIKALEDPDLYETLSDDFVIHAGECINEYEETWGNSKLVLDIPDRNGFDSSDDAAVSVSCDKFDGINSQNESIEEENDKLVQHLLDTEYCGVEKFSGEDPNDFSSELKQSDDINYLSKFLPDDSVSGPYQKSTLVLKTDKAATAVHELQLSEEDRFRILDFANKEDDESNNSFDWLIPQKRVDEWDCQSILTTRTQTPEQEPTRIVATSIKNKICRNLALASQCKSVSKLKKIIEDNENELNSENKQLNYTAATAADPPNKDSDEACENITSLLFNRPKNESLVDKKKRKGLIKQLQQDARKKKKERTLLKKKQVMLSSSYEQPHVKAFRVL